MSETTIIKGRWKLEKTEYAGGDLYELEIRRRFYVYDLKTGECILVFKGESDFSLSTAGEGWVSGGSYGVKEVTLEEDGLMVSYGEKKVRYQLPLRNISSEELLALNPSFEAFQKSKKQYWHEMDWASDVSIPMEAIKESHHKMMLAWDELERVLVRLGIREMVFWNMILPKRIKGGKKQVDGLLKWLEKEGHLWSREQVSSSR